MQAFQQILGHTGIPNPAPVTDDMVDLEDGAFKREELPEPDITAQVGRMRQAFAKPMQELQWLMDRYWPDIEFQGLPDEV